MPQVDPELFDRGQFQAELALKSSPIAAFKKAIRQAKDVLDARFANGRDIRRLVEDRAWFVDQILREAWARFDWSEDADIALLAVGGYGRGELHPYSDIDLLILLDSADHETFREPIEGFLTLLWDIGLEVGQSVRSVDECAEEARADLTVVTNLMESRTIAGPESLRRRMQEVTSPERMWPSKDFFLAKRQEQKARHAKYNDTEYNLEPNVKGSPAACATSRPSSGSPAASSAASTCTPWSRKGSSWRANAACSPPARSSSGRSATPCTCSPAAPKTACCSTTSASSPGCSASTAATPSRPSNTSCRSTTAWSWPSPNSAT